MSFISKLENAVKKNNSLLCVGLDTDWDRLPRHLLDHPHPLFSFNKAIIDTTHDLVAAYKPNVAYYETHGAKGLQALEQTVDYIREHYSHIPVICDAKRADIGSTSEQYAKSMFEHFNVDAVTVNPYLGFDAVEPFLRYKDRGVFILCRTSNPGATDFQDLKVKGMKLYKYVAKTSIRWNRQHGNCFLVVGATWPNQLKEVRDIAKKMWFLVPGLGIQGGDVETTMRFGLRKDSSGLLINASRSIIYAGKGENFTEAARREATKLRDKINQYR